MLEKYLNKDNLHHAYLIEGAHKDVVPIIIKFFESIKIETISNQDFTHIQADSFKVEDARNLKALSTEKAMTDQKKIFIISANNFLLEAQNTLLKTFEEPILNTHFFVILPDVNVLLSTFSSRFYLIKNEGGLDLKQAERFIKSSQQSRIEFIKELLVEVDEEEGEINLDSTRARALRFLNALESYLHNQIVKNSSIFRQIFKVRQFLRQPGSSAKSLMESVALITPDSK